ncbi:MurR/RpiR family transcriptional regulator [Ostreiculturibacter nitratireducens]|uniref:MurR/RpiR family transcriptional regulator n=1 Tax=Ostreiculturibacter nitratireducens TaxID=3075226 RepID=UPI0031B6108F
MPRTDAQSAPRPLVRRIHEAYSSLSSSERRIADTILESTSELAVWSASELAHRANVSNATVSRFFRRLQYANYEEARQAARRLRETGSPLFTGSTSSSARDPISKLVQEETAVIEATLSRLNPLTLREIGQAIAEAPRVRTLGFRNSHFLAQYVTAQVSQMRPGVAPMLLPGQTQAEGISTLGRGDLAIVVGLRRRPAGFARMVEAIASRGTQVLLLADQTVREAPAFATWTLDCVVNTSQFADSYGGAMAVLRLIVLEVRHALGERGRSHLEMVEELREELGELE